MLITGTSLSYCAKRCSVINTNIDARKWEVTVHSVTSNTLRDAQKSCIRMISRCNSRVFCELCSQKTPRGMLPVNSNAKDYSYRKLVKKNCQNGKIT